MGATFEVNDKFKNQIGAVLHPYLKLKDAFVNTNSAEASSAAKEVKATLGKVDMKLVKGDAHNAWMKLLEALNSSVATMSTSPDVEVQRQSFSTFTDQFYAAIQQFNVSGLEAYYQFCPMANNNKGAYWISKTSTIQNPYFGNKMMRCGETKLELK